MFLSAPTVTPDGNGPPYGVVAADFALETNLATSRELYSKGKLEDAS